MILCKERMAQAKRNVLFGLGYGYPVCCVLVFTLDVARGRAPGTLRGSINRGERTWVPCRWHRKYAPVGEYSPPARDPLGWKLLPRGPLPPLLRAAVEAHAMSFKFALSAYLIELDSQPVDDFHFHMQIPRERLNNWGVGPLQPKNETNRDKLRQGETKTETNRDTAA